MVCHHTLSAHSDGKATQSPSDGNDKVVFESNCNFTLCDNTRILRSSKAFGLVMLLFTKGQPSMVHRNTQA